jgi:hypothetical protein
MSLPPKFHGSKRWVAKSIERRGLEHRLRMQTVEQSILNAGDVDDLALADKLCELFEKHSIPLKISYYVWNGCDWSPTLVFKGQCHPYSGNNDRRGPHKDHIHVEFEDTNLGTKPISIIGDVIIPVHRFMATKDWNAPVSGWGSWDPENPDLKTAVM